MAGVAALAIAMPLAPKPAGAVAGVWSQPLMLWALLLVYCMVILDLKVDEACWLSLESCNLPDLDSFSCLRMNWQ